MHLLVPSDTLQLLSFIYINCCVAYIIDCCSRTIEINVPIWYLFYHVYGLVQDCSISIADALEMLQSCTKQSI